MAAGRAHNHSSHDDLLVGSLSREPEFAQARRGTQETSPAQEPLAARAAFVTSAGIDVKEAAQCVGRMHGDHRIQTNLTLVDRAARDELARQE
jgi:hypothetical protein